MTKHKHDWQLTGEANIPTGKYYFNHEEVIPITKNAIIHICRDCSEVKATIKELIDQEE